MSTVSRRVVLSVAIILLFIAINEIRRPLYRWDWFANLYEVYPQALPTVLWKTLQVALVVLAVMLLHRRGPVFALDELGLRRSPIVGFGAAFLATLPALILIAATGRFSGGLLFTWAFLMTAVASPLSEEMLFRGFLFGQLYRVMKWPFAAAVLMNVVPFAWGHLYQSDGSLWESAAVLLLLGIAAVFYAWVFVRWDYNLWVPIAHHALMNGYVEVFETGDSMIANVSAFAASAVGAIGMIVVTLYQRQLAERWRALRRGTARDGEKAG